MTLLHPVWLLLAIPLAAALWLWRPAGRWVYGLRIALCTAVVLAMCAPVIRLPGRGGVVVVVADRSLSMSPDSHGQQAEAIRLLQQSRGDRDALAVVSFGSESAIEQPPGDARFGGFNAAVNGEGSQLAEAIETAVSLIPAGRPGRVLVLTDGRWTGTPPDAAAAHAAAKGVAVDYRLESRPVADDLAVVRVDAPSTVTPEESCLLTAWVSSPVAGEVRYELTRGSQVIASGTRDLQAGMNRLVFRDRAGQAGTNVYRLRVRGATDDPVPENNQARFLVGVDGPKPLLCLARSPQSALPALLTGGGLNVRAAAPEDCDWSLEQLAQYSAVLIENTPAEKIGTAGMENLAAWVAQAGRGLMVTGGMDSYGPGGYFRSPLDPLLPVSMELRREHRKLAMAVVVALDRSGSMAVSVGGGKTKMDLADLAAAEVVDMLSAMDQFACVAVDSSSHVVVPLTAVEDKPAIRSKVLRIDSMGGGIFIYEALTAAVRELAKTQVGTRHIILFADAADSEQPGAYRELLSKSHAAGVTVSVIGLGKATDGDAELLRDIAKRGGGQCWFTDQPRDLPRLFAQDMFVVARSTFLQEQTRLQATTGLASLAPQLPGPLPDIGGTTCATFGRARTSGP